MLFEMETLFNILFYGIETYLFFHFIHLMNCKKYANWYFSYFIPYIFIVGVLSAVSLFRMPLLNFAFFLLLENGFCLIFFTNRRKWYLLYGIMFCVISEFTQYLADLSVMLISEAGIINMKVNMSKIHLLSAILGSLLKILAYYLFLRRSVYKKLKTATALQIGGYIMISSVSLIIIHTMIVLVNKERNTMDYIMIITTLIGVVILNVYFIVYIQYIYTANSLKNKLELSEQRITISYEYYKEVEDKYISLQKIIHDMKNHIQILENIYAEGATASTRKYREDICGFLELFGPKCYTSNIILNIIINHKVLLALKDNIKLLCEIDAVDLQFISEFDMTTIFCNLLDNAIAECKLLRTDREIYFKIRQFNSFIIINIVNKMSKSIHTWEEQIAFRRRLEMGTGLSNVKAAVENYNGDMRMYFEKDLFEVNISICSR